MAAGAPAGALRQQQCVIKAADEHFASGAAFGDVAFQAQRGVALGEQLGVHRAMRLMAGGAAFTHGFMLEHVRPALGIMALGADLCRRDQRRPRPLDGRPPVRIVAILASQAPLRYRVMIRQLERRPSGHVAIGSRSTGLAWDSKSSPARRRTRCAGCPARGRIRTPPRAHSVPGLGGLRAPPSETPARFPRGNPRTRRCRRSWRRGWWAAPSPSGSACRRRPGRWPGQPKVPSKGKSASGGGKRKTGEWERWARRVQS